MNRTLLPALLRVMTLLSAGVLVTVLAPNKASAQTPSPNIICFQSGFCCEPNDCSGKCGLHPDGCGGTMDCGPCPPPCGDGICTSGAEDCGTCLTDCPCATGTTCSANQCVLTDGGGGGGGGGGSGPVCGDGYCQAGESCSVDCGTSTKHAPVANAGGPYRGDVGRPILFTGAKSWDADGNKTISSFTWDFGDGGSAIGVAPFHSYSSPGSYYATLIVTDTSGLKGKSVAQVTVVRGEVHTYGWSAYHNFVYYSQYPAIGASATMVIDFPDSLTNTPMVEGFIQDPTGEVRWPQQAPASTLQVYLPLGGNIPIIPGDWELHVKYYYQPKGTTTLEPKGETVDFVHVGAGTVSSAPQIERHPESEAWEDIWWFGFNDSGDGYHPTTLILRLSPKTPAPYETACHWSVGGPIVKAEDSGCSKVVIRSTGAGFSAGDARVFLTVDGYLYPAEDYVITVHTPDSAQLIAYGNELLGAGYNSRLVYELLDNFGDKVRAVNISEYLSAQTCDDFALFGWKGSKTAQLPFRMDDYWIDEISKDCWWCDPPTFWNKDPLKYPSKFVCDYSQEWSASSRQSYGPGVCVQEDFAEFHEGEGMHTGRVTCR